MKYNKPAIYTSKQNLIETLVGSDDIVLDIGFWGQAIKISDPSWPHKILLKHALEVYGTDLHYDESQLEHKERYKRASAESFSFDITFDVIFAGDIIEHLSNPGTFLEVALRHLKPNGRLIITTPNCFSLFTLLEHVFKGDPVGNKDHTMYFNHIVLGQLLVKNGWKVVSEGYIDSFVEEIGFKRLLIGGVNRILKPFTPKYLETLTIVAQRE